MNDHLLAKFELLQQDQRYHLEAYQFIRESLAYAQKVMKMPATNDEGAEEKQDHHLTGQQLCQAIREYALEQFGFMSKTVLNSWGIYNTGDFGEIVYNLIRVKEMRKSKTDRREDFDDQFDFDVAFQPRFEISNDAG
jgi:uncharacterized repeat protein (TIGR04138 family)